MPINKQKISTAILSKSPCLFGLSDKTWTCGLYHPNRPEYLFLAVFAFSEAFCYAKTAFSYSRALLSPCTPDLFMVKDVVKKTGPKHRFLMFSGLTLDISDVQNLIRSNQRNGTEKAQNLRKWSNMWSSAKNGLVQPSKQERTSPFFILRKREISRGFARK